MEMIIGLDEAREAVNIHDKLWFKMCDAVRLGLDTFYMLTTDDVPDIYYTRKDPSSQGVMKYTMSVYAKERCIRVIAEEQDMSWWTRKHDWDACQICSAKKKEKE